MIKFPEAVIFDLDGTLIDSKEVYFKLLEETFKQLGVEEIPTRDKMLKTIRSANSGDLKRVFAKDILGLSEEAFKRAMKKIMKIFPEMFRSYVTLIPGADELLKSLQSLGIKRGLVTSTHIRNIKVKMYPLERTGIANLFESVVCIEDVLKRKPDPAPLIQCAHELGVSKEQCIYVGDSREDMRAGKAAGMITIGVLSGIGSMEELGSEEPVKIVDSVADLLKFIDFKN